MFEAHLRTQRVTRPVVVISSIRLSSLFPSNAMPGKRTKELKPLLLPDGWDENLDRLRQWNLDARWTKKNGINYYGSINSIYIDVDHRFIRRYAVIFDKIHVTQIISCLLDS